MRTTDRAHKLYDRIHVVAIFATFAVAPVVVLTSFLPGPDWVDSAALLTQSATLLTMLAAGRAARRTKPTTPTNLTNGGSRPR